MTTRVENKGNGQFWVHCGKTNKDRQSYAQRIGDYVDDVKFTLVDANKIIVFTFGRQPPDDVMAEIRAIIS